MLHLFRTTLAFVFFVSTTPAIADFNYSQNRDEEALKLLRSSIEKLEKQVKESRRLELTDGVVYKVNRAIYYGTAVATAAATAAVVGVWPIATVAEAAARTGYKKVESAAQKIVDRLAEPAIKLKHWTVLSLTAFLASSYVENWVEETVSVTDKEMHQLRRRIQELKRQVKEIEARIDHPL